MVFSHRLVSRKSCALLDIDVFGRAARRLAMCKMPTSF